MNDSGRPSSCWHARHTISHRGELTQVTYRSALNDGDDLRLHSGCRRRGSRRSSWSRSRSGMSGGGGGGSGSGRRGMRVSSVTSSRSSFVGSGRGFLLLLFLRLRLRGLRKLPHKR